MFTIPVQIVNDDLYDPTIEFALRLSAPDKCETGLYLYRCRVKIIENDLFPTNKYKDHQNAPGLGLMVEYVKFNFNNATVKKASKRAVIIDTLENLYYIWTLYLVKLLLDTA